MNTAPRTPRLIALLDRRSIAVALSVLYPTLFALSNNWYSLSSAKVLWLLGAAVLTGAALALAVEGAGHGLRKLAARAGTRGIWLERAGDALPGVLSGGLLFFLLTATLKAALGPALVYVALLLTCAVLAWAFVTGRQRYFAGALVLTSLAASVSWAMSYRAGRESLDDWAVRASEASREPVRLAVKPNIYLFIYDGYGSSDVYEKLYGSANEAHYRALEARGFEVVHSFSNYQATWPTTLAIFAGRHHYYRTSAGVEDSKFGRAVLAGLAPNPLLETLRDNGYRVQYVHESDYFVSEQGKLDYAFPLDRMHRALQVFGLPTFNKRLRKRVVRAHKSAVIERIAEPPSDGRPPWFTFSHVFLPGHSASSRNWTELSGFAATYLQRSRRANERMLEISDLIVARDPSAVIIAIGDHGGGRYRRAWTVDRDPNRAFAKVGVTPELMALDMFGIMIAVRSSGRCDGALYPGMTPVNLQPVLLACLNGQVLPPEQRQEDVSLFLADDPAELWAAAREGKALPEWERYQAP